MMNQTPRMGKPCTTWVISQLAMLYKIQQGLLRIQFLLRDASRAGFLNFQKVPRIAIFSAIEASIILVILYKVKEQLLKVLFFFDILTL